MAGNWDGLQVAWNSHVIPLQMLRGSGFLVSIRGSSCARLFLASVPTAGPRSSSRTRSCRIF